MCLRAGKHAHESWEKPADKRDGELKHMKDYESPRIRDGESTQGKEAPVRG